MKRNIAANEAHFWDCCSDVGHFLCGVGRVKRYVNVYFHLYRQQPEMTTKMSTLPTLEKYLRTPMPVLFVFTIYHLLCTSLYNIFVLFEYPLFQPLG